MEVSLHEPPPANEKYITLGGWWEAFTQNKNVWGKFCETHYVPPSCLHYRIIHRSFGRGCWWRHTSLSSSHHCSHNPVSSEHNIAGTREHLGSLKIKWAFHHRSQRHHCTCWGQLLHQNPPPLLRSWVAVPISWLLGLRVGENISNKIIIKILYQARYKKSHLMRNNKLHHYLLQKQWYYQIDSSHSTNVCNNNINEIEITAGWLSGDMWTLRAVFLLRINFINFYLIIITSITSKYLCNYY